MIVQEVAPSCKGEEIALLYLVSVLRLFHQFKSGQLETIVIVGCFTLFVLLHVLKRSRISRPLRPSVSIYLASPMMIATARTTFLLPFDLLVVKAITISSIFLRQKATKEVT